MQTLSKLVKVSYDRTPILQLPKFPCFAVSRWNELLRFCSGLDNPSLSAGQLAKECGCSVWLQCKTDLHSLAQFSQVLHRSVEWMGFIDQLISAQIVDRQFRAGCSATVSGWLGLMQSTWDWDWDWCKVRQAVTSHSFLVGYVKICTILSCVTGQIISTRNPILWD